MSTVDLCCPRCSVPLEAYERPVMSGSETVSADMCISCGGVWHDGPEVTVVYPEIGDVLSYAKHHGGISQLDCPVCRIGLVAFIVEGVALDVCRSCSGLWIDGYELLALEGARRAIIDHSERLAFGASYRSAAHVSGSEAEATTLCAGCGKEVARARVRRTADGDRCPLCIEVENEPISIPDGLFARALRSLMRKPE